jgi:pyruvate-ferredoxin/flavodoxin oxidoreductase
MYIANATGCSSIWGASAPSIPYTKDDDGKGPAWANSLFEDNAEYGYGIYLSVKKQRDVIKEKLIEYKAGIPDVDEALNAWIETYDDTEASRATSENLVKVFESAQGVDEGIKKVILDNKDQLNKKSIWIFGGDGWAYDIGYGGLDHVLASGEDVNVFVFDTEVYSNTGGQSSKSTPAAAVAKFAAQGKKVKKKDLGMMAAAYGYVYVAQVALGADMNQLIKALKEAEAYKGPSLIIGYAPCINHGIKSGMGTMVQQSKKAVETGYWHLYRYNPLNEKPFVLDSKEPNGEFMSFIESESRYTALKVTFPEIADDLFAKTKQDAAERYNKYKGMDGK